MFAGALLVALLALLVDGLLALAARRVSPLARSRRLTRGQAAELTFSAETAARAGI
jgi:hypothetical protein